MEAKQKDFKILSEFRQRRTRQLIAIVPIVAAIIFLCNEKRPGTHTDLMNNSIHVLQNLQRNQF